MIENNTINYSLNNYFEKFKKLLENNGMKSLKILPLAYPNVGKTYLIGSIIKLVLEKCKLYLASVA